MTKRILTAGLAVAIGCSFLPACSAKKYRASADKEVYHILSHRRKTELGTDKRFTLDRTPADPLKGLPRRFQPLVPGGAAASEPGREGGPKDPPAVISLARAVEIAIANSPVYQNRKEDVYLDTLSLTIERHAWSATFSALLSGKWQRVNKDESWVTDNGFGMSQNLATGATLSIGLGTQFLRYMTGGGGSRTGAASTLSMDFVQPLWRGCGQRVAQENLKQAERDVIYSIRSFARYHKTFTASVATAYYRLLRQRDAVRNEWHNCRRLRLSADRAANLAHAGRLPEFEVDQTRQDELRAQDRWIRAEQRYRELLDEFKITLGLATDAHVDVDDTELAKLSGAGIIHPPVSADGSVRQALALRLDLITAEDQVADAKRKVKVAKNGLGPDVTLVVSADVGTEGEHKPTKFRFDRGTYSGGLEVDLPFDRKAERNTYRTTLIALDRARRDAALLADNIKLQVRQAWRALQEARQSYDVQRISLELAQRRVESTALLLQAGRASTRDLLEAQSALLEAQNAVTRALVDHTVARIELWRDIGTLVVTPRYDIKEDRFGGEPQLQETSG